MNRLAGGHIFALITILIWGTTFISTKLLLDTLSPLEILFSRFLIGYLVLWCVCPHRLAVQKKKQEWYFAAAGLCGVTLYYLCENVALTYTSASNVGVIISVAPFFTAIFSCLFLRERRPSIWFYAGFVLALGGISLISFAGEQALRLNPLGDLLAMAAAIIWAAYATLSKKLSEFGYGTVQTARRTFFYGLLFMLPTLLFTDSGIALRQLWEIKNIGNLLFLGVGASALCFVTWNCAVKTLGSVKTSIYIYMVPVITAATSSLILHESMTPATLLGIGLTLAGLFLSEAGRGEKEKKENTGRWKQKTGNAS